ncbi:uncharacterized protein PHACADRAFT_63287, partial [Phanerochaete carnosa HHB-10118-sp]
ELSPQDMDILLSYAYRVRTQLTKEDFEMLPFAYRAIPQLSGNATDSRAAFLSGLDPILYHCCPKSCVCYVGPYAELQSCPTCGTSRYNARERPRKIFTYIPLTPRLVGLHRNPEIAKKLQYRSDYNISAARHTVNDVFDGSHYRSLR